MASDRVALPTEHNRTALSARLRHPSQRAAATNDPLALPEGMSLVTARGRRWRDLADHYARLLGADRLQHEATRARLRSVLWLSVELERLQSERMCDRPVPLHTVLHATQELRALLTELGLSDATRSNDVPDPLAYAREVDAS